MRFPFPFLCLLALLPTATLTAARPEYAASNPRLQEPPGAPVATRNLPDVPVFREKKSSQAINVGAA